MGESFNEVKMGKLIISAPLEIVVVMLNEVCNITIVLGGFLL